MPHFYFKNLLKLYLTNAMLSILFLDFPEMLKIRLVQNRNSLILKNFSNNKRFLGKIEKESQVTNTEKAT